MDDFQAVAMNRPTKNGNAKTMARPNRTIFELDDIGVPPVALDQVTLFLMRYRKSIVAIN